MKLALTISLCVLSACTPHDTDPSGEVDSNAAPKASFTSFKRELTEVKGSAVDFGIQSFVAISCAKYDKQFLDATSFLITDRAKLTAISHHLANLHPDSRNIGLDVRAKAILVYSDQTNDTLCIGKFNSYYGGRIVAPDQKLYQLLGVGVAQ